MDNVKVLKIFLNADGTFEFNFMGEWNGREIKSIDRQIFARYRDWQNRQALAKLHGQKQPTVQTSKPVAQKD